MMSVEFALCVLTLTLPLFWWFIAEKTNFLAIVNDTYRINNRIVLFTDDLQVAKNIIPTFLLQNLPNTTVSHVELESSVTRQSVAEALNTLNPTFVIAVFNDLTYEMFLHLELEAYNVTQAMYTDYATRITSFAIVCRPDVSKGHVNSATYYTDNPPKDNVHSFYYNSPSIVGLRGCFIANAAAKNFNDLRTTVHYYVAQLTQPHTTFIRAYHNLRNNLPDTVQNNVDVDYFSRSRFDTKTAAFMLR
jgi:hypothetical protein